VSDLITEYDALLCLFRIPGDATTATHHSYPQRSSGVSPSVGLGQSIAPTAPLPTTTTSSTSTTGNQGFYSSLYGRPPPPAAEPAPKLVGSDSVYTGAGDGGATSYLVGNVIVKLISAALISNITSKVKGVFVVLCYMGWVVIGWGGFWGGLCYVMLGWGGLGCGGMWYAMLYYAML
jgi:hypothetical protein